MVESLVIGFSIGLVFGFFLFVKRKPEHSKALKKISETFGLEENTLVNIMMQELEDNKHYRNYEQQRLLHDYQMLTERFYKTQKAICEFPDLAKSATPENIARYKEKYERYLLMCKKLNITFEKLSIEQFVIGEENPMFCMWVGAQRITQQVFFMRYTMKKQPGTPREI